MSLKDRINEDINSALKGGSKDVASTLRFLTSVIKNKEIEKRIRLSKEGKPADELEMLSQLTDEEMVSVIHGDIKKREKSIDQYKKGNRADLVDDKNEIKRLNKIWLNKNYTPDELSFGLNSHQKRNLPAGRQEFAKTKNKVLELGEVFINSKKTNNKKHLTKLLIHSLLHLLGHHHEKSEVQ